MEKRTEELFTGMNKYTLDLTAIVDETIAYCYKANNHRVFTSAELWNIQRQQKSRLQRRFSL